MLCRHIKTVQVRALGEYKLTRLYLFIAQVPARGVGRKSVAGGAAVGAGGAALGFRARADADARCHLRRRRSSLRRR
jgi:hypothetical protein